MHLLYRRGIDLHRLADEYSRSAGLLVDSYHPGIPGGTGEIFDWDRIPKDLPLPLILAGGGIRSARVAELFRKFVDQVKVPVVNSLVWCQGKLYSAQENRLVIKTKASRLNEIIRLVKELHSYDVPEIIALPIVGGNQNYLDWIDEEVK